MSNESGAVLTEQEEATERDSSNPMTMEDYLHYESEAFKTPNHGDIVDGIVVRVDADEVLVDIGAKAEGVISSKELGLRGEADSVGLEPGDQIKVYVLQPENEEGNVVLSLRRARAETTWIVAAEKQTDGSVIDADVREQNKGGLIVNVLGLRGFLPSSQVARAYAGSLESLVGQRIPVKILEVNRKRNRLIVSQKAAEDEDRARKREDLFSRLLTGTHRQGHRLGHHQLRRLRRHRRRRRADPHLGAVVGPRVQGHRRPSAGRRGHRQGDQARPRADPHLALAPAAPAGPLGEARAVDADRLDRRGPGHQDQEVRRLPADHGRASKACFTSPSSRGTTSSGPRTCSRWGRTCRSR